MALTGKFTFRKTLWGKIVLQVEEEVKPFWRPASDAPKRRWRDAKVMDLADTELRHLMDLRYKPFLRYHSGFAAEAAPAPREEVAAEPAAAAQPGAKTQPEATVIRIAH